MRTFLLGLSTLWWAGQAYGIARGMRALTRLSRLPARELPRWPRVSVVVPARNEGPALRDAVEAKLGDGYPELELVLVDDRSTDDTPQIARALAERDARIQVVRVDALPAGWLGKVHALERGLELARGEWILFSDADVHLAPGTLTRLIAHAEREGLDHLAALPKITAKGPLISPALASFFRFIAALSRPWAVRDPRSRAAFGVGAFNLFRREALERSPGLSALRLEIGDDVELGVLLKRTGARQAVVVAGEAVCLDFYPSTAAMVRALEKNGAMAPLPLQLLGNTALLTAELGWLSGLAGSAPHQRWAAALWLFAAALQLQTSRWLSLPRWPAAVPFLGLVPLCFAVMRSAVMAAIRGGVRWRGTFYPSEALRAAAKERRSLLATLPRNPSK